MAQTLVTFENGKLSLNAVSLPDTSKLRVLSVVGKGRRGKSTFLNSIVSALKGENVSPFQTSDGDEHCTKSIDAYAIPELNLLLLDSRGLDYEDSRNDPALLLFVHQVSDLVLFNDRQRLDNSALKLLEPVCAFTNYLSEEMRKPKLYFRIADCEIKDSGKAIQMLLATYADQYQSIRDSVRHLFDPDIRLIRTEQLDKKARTSLDEGQYLQVLKQEDYGFHSAIEEILKGLPASSDGQNFLERLTQVATDINGSEEIAIEKLDVVKLQAQLDMKTWIEKNISPALFTEIVVDGTQASFDTNVEPRKNQKKSALAAFTKKFKAVATEIRAPLYRDLDERLAAPIQKAIEESRMKALQLVNRQLGDAQRDQQFQTFNNANNSFTTIQDSWFDSYLHTVTALSRAIEDKYVAVKEEISAWIESVRKVLFETVASLREEEAVQQAKIQALCDKCLETFPENFLAQISSGETLDLTKSNQKMLEEFRDAVCAGLVAEIKTLIPFRSVDFQIKGKKMKVGLHTVVGGIRVVELYDLVSPIYQEFLTQINTLIGDSSNILHTTLTETKEQQLEGKMFADTAVTQVILRENPQIQFVQDRHADFTFLSSPGRKSYYMSKATHQAHIEVLYVSIAKKMVEKGYIKSPIDILNGLLKWSLHAPLPNVTIINYAVGQWNDAYKISIQTLWTHQVQKEIARSYVQGHHMPVEVTE